MKLIELSKTGTRNNGKYFVQVDDEDLEWLNQWRWSIFRARKAIYAIRKTMGKRIKGQPRKMLKRYFMHREVMRRHGRLDESLFLDHADRNPLNCQKYNLRNATHGQNAVNKNSLENSTSKYLGVCKTTDKRSPTIKYGWMSCIRANKKTKHLGRFSFTKEGEIQAALAYNEAAKKYHGEFANLNCVPIPTIPFKQYLSHGI